MTRGMDDKTVRAKGQPQSDDSTVRLAAAQGDHPLELAPVDPDNYVERVEITEGGMGRIVSAYDRRLKRRVAIKELRGDGSQLRARFEREVLLTARLQHPSIVSIHEAGVWPSGEPFYAMKLVPGRSLDQIVDAATSLDDRLALLPHVLAIADALAYAHAEHVIHRDLKPQNVLVGDFGETVVIDWGLAKDLADANREPEASSGGPVADDATAIGEVMGTPAYMPPEQAEGRAVDERADVYAIGAILYYTLAGKRPYDGITTRALLDAVKHESPTPLGDRQPGVPADLLAIVARAMSRDPAKRYPTARELAEDLHRFEAGQLVGAHRYSRRQLLARWLRRHRTAVAVAGVAVAILLGGGTFAILRIVREEQRAETARALADEHRADAEELMGFMLGDLRNRLEPIGKLDLLRPVATKARDYYGRRPATSALDRQQQAHALRNVGDVLKDGGDIAGALAEYRAASALAELAATSGDAEARDELAQCHEKIGAAVMAQGDTATALVENRAALAIHEQLASADPARQRDVARNHDQVGDVLEAQGDLTHALDEFRAVLKLDPADGAAQRQLAIGHGKVGRILFAQGSAPNALVEQQAALAILVKLQAADPGNARLVRDVSITHAAVGNMFFAQGQMTAALAAYRESELAAVALTQRDPSNATWQSDLALTREDEGNALLQLGDLPGALAAYRAELTSMQAIAERDPASTGAQYHLSMAHQKLTNVYMAQHDVPNEVLEARAAKASQLKLTAQNPTNLRWQADLANSYSNLGDALQDQGDLTAALVEYRAKLALSEQLVAKDPTNREWHRLVSTSHDSIGNALLTQGDAKAALVEFRAGMAIAEKLIASDPTNAEWKPDVAGFRKDIGNAFVVQGDVKAALVEFRASLAILDKLVAEDPANPQWKGYRAELAGLVAHPVPPK